MDRPARPSVSATEPDWSREQPIAGRWEPGKQLLRVIRRYQACQADGGLTSRWRSRWYALEWRFWSAVSGADIPLDAQIGGGLALPHPNGIVIHPGVTIGVNCLLMQQVTLGLGRTSIEAPVIGGHVDIGAGARIIGAVTIGDHARVGANAVVLRDVPAGATAVGIPARIVEREET